MYRQPITIGNIKYGNRCAGKFFFEPSSMRFFRSRICPTVHEGPGGVYFVSSEQFDDRSPRLYTVRQYIVETGAVETPGEFQQYETARKAHRVAAQMAAQETATEDEDE